MDVLRELIGRRIIWTTVVAALKSIYNSKTQEWKRIVRIFSFKSNQYLLRTSSSQVKSPKFLAPMKKTYLKLTPDTHIRFDESVRMIHHDSIVVHIFTESKHNLHLLLVLWLVHNYFCFTETLLDLHRLHLLTAQVDLHLRFQVQNGQVCLKVELWQGSTRVDRDIPLFLDSQLWVINMCPVKESIYSTCLVTNVCFFWVKYLIIYLPRVLTLRE